MVRWRSVLRVFCASARVAFVLLSFFSMLGCTVARWSGEARVWERVLAWLASRVFLKSLLGCFSFLTKENINQGEPAQHDSGGGPGPVPTERQERPAGKDSEEAEHGCGEVDRHPRRCA